MTFVTAVRNVSKWRVVRLIVWVTLLKPFSNVFLARGMHDVPYIASAHPDYLLRAFLDPFVIAGIVMQIVWLLLRMSLLSIADLTFVLPVTAAGYVVSTLLGQLLLHETVSLERWIGVILITIGTAAVASTPRITPKQEGE
jgi:uncharacterized membrane protein